jgi:DNA-binding LacI/PurR family transcriptional regulator
MLALTEGGNMPIESAPELPASPQAAGPGPRPRTPGLAEVAALAGVSHQTVSRVLNEQPHVRDQTRLRVLSAIAELGYRPNSVARALASGKSRTLGVVMQTTSLFGPASLLHAFEIAARQAGYFVSVSSLSVLNDASLTEAVQRHLDQRVDGLVIIAPLSSEAAVLRGLPAELPVVVIDGGADNGRDVVTVDQVAGAQAATDHLLAAGHATVWHVTGPGEWLDAQGRIEGWRAALAGAGAVAPPPLAGDWSAASGFHAGELLSRMSEVTAVFAANDHMALGVMRALHERGLRVPDDVSVVGFDDVPEAGFYIPPLTTIRPDFHEVGRASLQLLVEQMSAPRGGPVRRSFVPTLVDRRSVAHPRG